MHVSLYPLPAAERVRRGDHQHVASLSRAPPTIGARTSRHCHCNIRHQRVDVLGEKIYGFSDRSNCHVECYARSNGEEGQRCGARRRRRDTASITRPSFFFSVKAKANLGSTCGDASSLLLTILTGFFMGLIFSPDGLWFASASDTSNSHSL